jgi:hypothetical protein
MPQLTNVVLKDNANADHTFTPNDIQGGVASLVETTGVPLGDKRITISLTQTSQGRRKVTTKLSIPVVQDAVVAGVTKPTIVRTAYAELTLSFDSSSSAVERKDVISYIKSLMANAMYVSTAGDLQGIY